jgi:two-component sensor histidine kinase/putative methionine-R-sulfoxide reductase with GAF domain
LAPARTRGVTARQRWHRPFGIRWTLIEQSGMRPTLSRPATPSTWVRRGVHRLAENRAKRLLQERASLAEFGLHAVEGADLDELLQQAAAEAARSLDVSYVKVLQYLPDEKRLLVRAGVGWGKGVIGNARIGAEIESPAGYALQTGQPMISNDLQKEERFRIPALLQDHGVKSAVNVIIKTKDRVFGVLEADSREPREFDQDDVKFLQGYATLLAFAIDQARLSELNAQLAAQHEILMQELQHRIKNNNQSLLSMIRLQLHGVAHPETRDNLQKIENRIRVLTLVSSQLQMGARADVVDLGQYLMAIVSSLFNFQSESGGKVKLITQIAPVEIATARAQAIGLVLNEFLTNSFKYAFAQGSGTFRLNLSQNGASATLIMADDGPGIAADATPSLGHKLIESFTQQLEGQAAWQSDAKGTKLTLEFPVRVS